MPVVLVHGVPETATVWRDLRRELSRADVFALELPGFGHRRPAGFGATKDGYVAWLVNELERIGDSRPVDLVGHDWGGAFAIRVVTTRSDLVRSWVTDAAAIVHESFEWHEFARIWQAPGLGEEFFERELRKPDAVRAPMMRQVDRTMAECILSLYRSAVDVNEEWGPDFRDVPSPGLVLIPGEDEFLSPAQAREVAARAGASVVELDGVGHRWMLEDPGRSARVLEAFWGSV